MDLRVDDPENALPDSELTRVSFSRASFLFSEQFKSDFCQVCYQAHLSFMEQFLAVEVEFGCQKKPVDKFCLFGMRICVQYAKDSFSRGEGGEAEIKVVLTPLAQTIPEYFYRWAKN